MGFGSFTLLVCTICLWHRCLSPSVSPVYIWSRKQHPDQNPMFLKYEKVLLVLLVLVALFSLYLFMRGIVKL